MDLSIQKNNALYLTKRSTKDSLPKENTYKQQINEPIHGRKRENVDDILNWNPKPRDLNKINRAVYPLNEMAINSKLEDKNFNIGTVNFMNNISAGVSSTMIPGCPGTVFQSERAYIDYVAMHTNNRRCQPDTEELRLKQRDAGGRAVLRGKSPAGGVSFTYPNARAIPTKDIEWFD